MRAEAIQQDRPAHGHDPAGRRYRYTAAVVIALGSVTSILSSTVVNVAIPALQNVFHANLTDIQWVVTGYLLGLSAVIPISGWLTERLGSKTVYLVTLAAFTATSLLCGFAWSTESEIAFRVIQGLAGGMVMPVGMTILMRITPPSERGTMMGILGLPMLLAPAVGPALGGWLLQAVDWRWIFWVNVPTGIAAVLFGFFLLEETPRRTGERLDFLGLLLATPGVAIVIYGLTQAGELGWTAWQTWVPLAAGLVLVAAFVAWELRTAVPLLDISVFRDSAFSAAITVSVIINFALFGATFLIPVFQQQIQGYDTLGAGLLVAASGFGAAVVMPVAGRLTDRYGARPVVFFGLTILAVASFLLTIASPETTRNEWIVLLALRGIGMGCAMMPAFSAAYITIAPAAIGRATALANTLQRIAASFGVAVLATVAAARATAHIPAALPHSPAAKGIVLAAAARGFDDALWLAAGFALLGLPAALLLRRPLTQDQHREQEGVLRLRHPRLAPQLRVVATLLVVLALTGLGASVKEALSA